MVRILVACRHKLMREGIKRIVCGRGDCAVVGEAVNDIELLKGIRCVRPDLLMLEPTIGATCTTQVIRTVQSIAPPLPILVCETRPTDHQALDLIRAGARGYVSKAIGTEDLIMAIRKVASGQIYVGEELAEQIAWDLMAANDDVAPHTRLSKREQEVLGMLAAGLSVTEVGQTLKVSVKTVSTHKSRLLARLGLRGTSELILYAIKHGLIQIDTRKVASARTSAVHPPAFVG
jgi:DNA-binding NarL/FixJ family response regulator